MRTHAAVVTGLALLAIALTAEAQSKGYRPPPPPPPRPAPVTSSPPRSAPMTPSPSRPSTLPSSRTAQTPPAKSTPSADRGKANTSELQKSVGAETKQIDALRARVNNPQANYPNWNALSRDRQSALLNQWTAELQRREGSRASAQRALGQRTR